MGLAELGWDERWREALAEAGGELQPARVVAEHRGAFVVDTGEGSSGREGEAPAEPSGRLRLDSRDGADWPTVGDWIAGRATPDLFVIERVLPRRTALQRQQAGRVTGAQVVASNIDVVFVVSGLDGDFNPRRVERALVLVRESGARPVVLLNKADVCPEAEERRRTIESVALGAPVHLVSAATGSGIDHVRAALPTGTTSVLLGSSGVGKSTLVNRLLGEARQALAPVRDDDSRGRHTTTARQLFTVPGGGMVIDTPGVRELQLWGAPAALDTAFGDVDALAGSCRFADCRHEREPGCAVAAAVAAGALPPERLASYHKLARELRHLETRVDALARGEEKRRWRSIHRLARRHRPRE